MAGLRTIKLTRVLTDFTIKEFLRKITHHENPFAPAGSGLWPGSD
jgi:hypothetical protein